MRKVMRLARALPVREAFSGPSSPLGRFQAGAANPSITLIIAWSDIAWHFLSLLGPPGFEPGTKGL